MKVLIIEPTFIPNTTDERAGPIALGVGSTPDVDKTTARQLVDAGKALYTDKEHDPTKGQRTASEKLLEAHAAAMKAAEAPSGKA